MSDRSSHGSQPAPTLPFPPSREHKDTPPDPQPVVTFFGTIRGCAAVERKTAACEMFSATFRNTPVPVAKAQKAGDLPPVRVFAVSGEKSGTLSSISILAGVSALSLACTAHAAINLLVNGDYEAAPILGAGQSDVGEGATKWTTTDPAGPEYLDAVSGIVGWTYGLDLERDPPNVHTDIGPTRAERYAGERALFINRWERMVHQAAGAVEASKTCQADLFVYAAGGLKAGRLMLIVGGIDAANELTPGSILLSERTFGTSDWTGFVPDQELGENQWTRVRLDVDVPTSGPAIGMPLVYAFEIADGSAGELSFDAGSLVVIPAPCTLALAGLALRGRERR